MHEHGIHAAAGAAILAEVAEGLGREQKQLSPKLFYDERGSELFDEITRLPEYYPTRMERMLLRTHAAGWLRTTRPRALVELGAGSGDKTRILLDAMPAGGWYVPIDISPSYLAEVAATLGDEYPQLRIEPIESDITAGPVVPADAPRPAVIAFLGSTIGNFEHSEAIDLLRHVRDAMTAADRFLMGADLVKDVGALERAYNDTRGVTAAFNLNVLTVLNRELGADFDPTGFEHRAFFDTALSRIEMHLVSKREQSVTIPAAGSYRFSPGETIRTEISCKYTRRSVDAMFREAGLHIEQWITDASAWYALAIGRVRP